MDAAVRAHDDIVGESQRALEKIKVETAEVVKQLESVREDHEMYLAEDKWGLSCRILAKICCSEMLM